MQLPPLNWLDRFGRGRGPAIIAHRGNHERTETENDLPALEAMARDGVSDAVEMDIRRLGDGTLVIHHDAALTDGPRVGVPLGQLTAADLRAYPRLATLEAWARRAGELGVNVLAEFKESGYEAVALDVLHRFVAPEHLAAFSFNQRALQGIHAADPSLPVGLLASRAKVGRPTLVDQLRSLGFTPHFVEFNADNATVEALGTAQAFGIDLMFGTGNAAWQRELIGNPAVLGFLTDRPTAEWRVRDGVPHGFAALDAGVGGEAEPEQAPVDPGWF
ncbi:MAG: glycerophosphoryl diester phosphodiesterase [Thermoleophilia bacterium]|nr:glycerophosphoryl diester phosphodiesterase [Thermoleophilia bacterium]